MFNKAISLHQRLCLQMLIDATWLLSWGRWFVELLFVCSVLFVCLVSFVCHKTTTFLSNLLTGWFWCPKCDTHWLKEDFWFQAGPQDMLPFSSLILTGKPHATKCHDKKDFFLPQSNHLWRWRRQYDQAYNLFSFFSDSFFVFSTSGNKDVLAARAYSPILPWKKKAGELGCFKQPTSGRLETKNGKKIFGWSTQNYPITQLYSFTFFWNSFKGQTSVFSWLMLIRTTRKNLLLPSFWPQRMLSCIGVTASLLSLSALKIDFLQLSWMMLVLILMSRYCFFHFWSLFSVAHFSFVGNMKVVDLEESNDFQILTTSNKNDGTCLVIAIEIPKDAKTSKNVSRHVLSQNYKTNKLPVKGEPGRAAPVKLLGITKPGVVVSGDGSTRKCLLWMQQGQWDPAIADVNGDGVPELFAPHFSEDVVQMFSIKTVDGWFVHLLEEQPRVQLLFFLFLSFSFFGQDSLLSVENKETLFVVLGYDL